MYLLIDNYDSFTYNLYHYLLELGVAVEVYRNDAITVEDVTAKAPHGIVISPGPATPDDAGICLELVRRLKGRIPIFGVCLGHQTIGQIYGGKVVRAPYVMHGKVSYIYHAGDGLFKDIPSPYLATRYHSLIVERDSLPQEASGSLRITAETEDKLIMGVEDAGNHIYGVQYHPESIATEYGHQLLKNFVDICETFPLSGRQDHT